MTAARRLEPPFSGAYGVSCRARAKRAALRRTKTAIRPWPPRWPLGPPPNSGGAGRSSAGHNDRGKIHKLSAVMSSGRTDRSSIPRISPRRSDRPCRAARAGRRFAGVFWGLGRQRRIDERERDLGPRADARLEDELVGRVRPAAEGSEAVHGE